jgi:HD-GYP domain-containing protein (c-di-GMP phosphodiesterase class II)
VNRLLYTGISGLVGAGAAVAIAREHQRRGEAERLAAATLETLLNAIDANDALTGAHVRRVATYALILAGALGLDETRKREIERVALFHDIGKIHEALFDIIHDDDGLTPDERRAIATHPARGADVLAPLASFYPRLPRGVLAHHERWDGTGYPARLRGPAIPLESRIVAIADTFDAITASRRYHRGEAVERANDVIRKGSGTQFDPMAAAVFLAPSVQRPICTAMHEALRGKPARRNRRHAEIEPHAPDVRFRWRRTAPPPEPAKSAKSAKSATEA